MPRNAVAYDEDFFAWTEEQARLLRAGEVAALDLANIAEEIESMGRSLRRELRSRIIVLLVHLLKWQYQPGFRSRSWSSTIREQRRQIGDLLDDAPSLEATVSAELIRLYQPARDRAVDETGLPETAFPADCPFTPEQILAEGFLPED
ncbi:MAG TPA: DUF29 domain-containing protein [Stellaceae bacterium]|jgi:hypothetical protein|nr:DUF29 domain-containing protein [Stellaceae bacterium]